MLMCNNNSNIIYAEGNFLKYSPEEILHIPEKLRDITRCSALGLYVLQDKVTLDANLVLAGIKVTAT